MVLLLLRIPLFISGLLRKGWQEFDTFAELFLNFVSIFYYIPS